MEPSLPSLTAFEARVAARDLDAAVAQAARILGAIDDKGGLLGGVDPGPDIQAGEASARDLQTRFATRFAAAFGDLLTHPDTAIGAVLANALFIYHRNLDLIFAVGGFQTSAHFLQRLADRTAGRVASGGSSLVKFLILFSPSSHRALDLDACFALDPVATASAVLGYLSAACCFTVRASAFRERALAWLPGRLASVMLPPAAVISLAGVYMHCSYAAQPAKHRVKADIIAQFRRICLAAGAREMPAPPPDRARPRIVVVFEHFHSRHSVFRTHSRAVRSLRARFEVIGVGLPDKIDAHTRAYFDALIPFQPGHMVTSACVAASEIVARAPDIVFYLGVGMATQVTALASLRLAPIQCVSHGHTATTMSPVIDHMILPDDFVGAEACFSERLMRLPPAAIPYAPPLPGEAPPPPRPPVAALEQGVLRIAVPAAVMKINAPFLATLAEIARRAARPVEFVFLPLSAKGLVHYHLAQEVLRVLPRAVVHPELAKRLYLERLGACAFFLSPFPYGNMNSIIDAIIMGVPGLCLDGEEAHAHADGAIFRRLGLPDALCAASRDDYVAMAVRLIDDADWRAHCRAIARAVDLEETFYKGDERLFCDAMVGLLAKPQPPPGDAPARA